MISEGFILAVIGGVFGWLAFKELYNTLSFVDVILFSVLITGVVAVTGAIIWEFKSKTARDRKKRIQTLKETPRSLLLPDENGVLLGFDEDLRANIYLPDSLRRRHVHILGATGSGKTESVILNLLRQDAIRGLGAIILDAKGDHSFLKTLNQICPKERLVVFDLGSDQSATYNPIAVGTPLEACQRLFSSLTWSEEYYKSKALSTLQKLFQTHHAHTGKNPRLIDLSEYLEDPESFTAVAVSETYPKKMAEKDFMELSGLRDQIKTLCIGHLSTILSPSDDSKVKLEEVTAGKIVYFRLQSLMSPQLVSIVGKLIINHLNFLAGTAHRSEQVNGVKLIPTYLDEFASFACPEFADLISKARSAGLALHFSHQSIGDLTEISEGFINRITDNSGTKIVLRINDPDSAEFFARSFGTRIYQKTTQRITNTKEMDLAEVVGEGTQRDAHQFRASPDLFKTLPTGVGSVLIAHGERTPSGASSVFKITFPRLEINPMEIQLVGSA